MPWSQQLPVESFDFLARLFSRVLLSRRLGKRRELVREFGVPIQMQGVVTNARVRTPATRQGSITRQRAIAVCGSQAHPKRKSGKDRGRGHSEVCVPVCVRLARMQQPNQREHAAGKTGRK